MTTARHIRARASIGSAGEPSSAEQRAWTALRLGAAWQSGVTLHFAPSATAEAVFGFIDYNEPGLCDAGMEADFSQRTLRIWMTDASSLDVARWCRVLQACGLFTPGKGS